MSHHYLNKGNNKDKLIPQIEIVSALKLLSIYFVYLYETHLFLEFLIYSFINAYSVLIIIK